MAPLCSSFDSHRARSSSSTDLRDCRARVSPEAGVCISIAHTCIMEAASALVDPLLHELGLHARHDIVDDCTVGYRCGIALSA